MTDMSECAASGIDSFFTQAQRAYLSHFKPFIAGIDFIRQNLTYKVGPRTERMTIFLMAVHNIGIQMKRKELTRHVDDFKMNVIRQIRVQNTHKLCKNKRKKYRLKCPAKTDVRVTLPPHVLYKLSFFFFFWGGTQPESLFLVWDYMIGL